MRILITGGCGFIGVNLVKRLMQEGFCNYLRIVDDLSVGTREALEFVFSDVGTFEIQNQKGVVFYNVKNNSHPVKHKIEAKCELLIGDIRDKSLAVKACYDMDVVVHLAASTGVLPSIENPREDCEANVIGTLNYLEASRLNNVEKFIFASSGAPLGEQEPPIHEEKVPKPISPYGASKLAGEGYCSVYFRTFGVETVSLRFGNVYGPGSGHKNSVVARFIRQAMHGEVLEIYGDGTQTRDFIYIDDLVRAIQLAVTKDRVGGELFQIATNAETTVGELAERLLPILSEAGIKNVKVCHTAPRPGDMKRNYSDTSKAKGVLGWQAEVGLEEGLKRTVEWFIESCYEIKHS